PGRQPPADRPPARLDRAPAPAGAGRRRRPGRRRPRPVRPRGRAPGRRHPPCDAEAQTRLAPPPAAPASAVDAWKAAGAEVLICEPAGRAVDLPDLTRALGERGVLELLVEGGPRLQASLWAAGLADRLVWYLA